MHKKHLDVFRQRERGLHDDLLKVQYRFHCLIFTCETEGNEIVLDVLENRTGEIVTCCREQN
jgi:hypothetical protein